MGVRAVRADMVPGLARATLVLGAALLLLGTVMAPAASAVAGGNPPSVECGDLLYLDKFDFDERSFDQGTTTNNSAGGSFDYVSSTGVRVQFEEDEGEVFVVTWTSDVPLDLVFLKAGNIDQNPDDATFRGQAYDEAVGPATVEVDGKNAFSHITFCYDETPGSVEVAADCVEGTSTVTVTVDQGDDPEYEVEVFIDDVSQGFISETTSYPGTAGSILTVTDGASTTLAEIEFLDCTEPPPPPPPPPPPTPSTATFGVTSQCSDVIPVLDYTVVFTQGDDPITSVTLTFTDAAGDVLTTTEVAGDSDGTGQLAFADQEGESVTVSWDLDDSVEELTIADGCSEVLGVVIEQEPDPVPDVSEVMGEVVEATEELPLAGVEDMLAIFGGALLAAGCLLLLAESRPRRARG